NYSDDFEDEYVDAPLTTKDEDTHSKENSESEKISTPKQVYVNYTFVSFTTFFVLLDSLDSVAEINLDEQVKTTPKPKDLPEMTDNEMTGTDPFLCKTGTQTSVSYGQSNSDIEALHQAYCHIAHSLGDEGEQKIESNTIEDTKSSVKGHPQESEEHAKNISTMESDLPTVEELMKPIRIDSFGEILCQLIIAVWGSEKVAESKETEFVSSLPPKMNPNIISQHSQNINHFFDKNDENDVILQQTTNESMENSYPRVTATEEHVDKMYLDILRKKISVNPSSLSQDDRISKAYRSQLSSEEEGAVMGKPVPYKKSKSAPPLLKRKPQRGLYASVRSSGYGKPSSPLKMFSTLEKKTSEDIMKSRNLRSIPTSNQPRKKDCLLKILSGTKLIKPAALDKPALKTESCLATPQKFEDPTETDFCIQLHADFLGYCGENKEKELLMFKRVHEAEEKWRGAQALIEQIKVTFSEKEKELENKLEELKKQREKELFKLNQDNYILQVKLSSFEETNKKQRWIHFGEAADPVTGDKLKQIQKEIQEQETLLQGYQQENERLYNQVKDLQEQNKKNEERMFKENQSLFSEVASLKEQMHKSRFLSQVVEDSEPTRNQNFTDLLAELRMAQYGGSVIKGHLQKIKQGNDAVKSMVQLETKIIQCFTNALIFDG
ncbi:hypothetical protein P7K49_008266, partial [Saguinus oedipus]